MARTSASSAGGAAKPDYTREYSAGELKYGESVFGSWEILSGSVVHGDCDYYDCNQIEYRNGVYRVPSDFDPNGTITFSICWQPRTAPSVAEDVVWQIEFVPIADGEQQLSTAYTAVVATADTCSTTQNVNITTSWTVANSTAGWAANDLIQFRFSRKATDANDTLDTRTTTADDAGATSYRISAPRI